MSNHFTCSGISMSKRYRFKHRKLTDGERFSLAVSNIVGHRVAYEELTGEASEEP